jgi:Putative DNA-binding domain
MATGSFARGPLAELTGADLERMLELDESLFVEHKRDIGEESQYQLAKAVSSFANTLGGWLLIGVHDGKPAGREPAWASSGAPTLVDLIRDRLRGEVDPLPAFEAKTMRLPGLDGAIGVVRVYESSDTPHIVIRSGSIFVREVAGDTDAVAPRKPGTTKRDRQRYEATQIRSRAQLIDLAQRGEVAAARVRALLDYRARPPTLVEDHLGLTFELVGEQHWQPRARQDRGSIFVRVAPYTGSERFQGWATTAGGAAAVIAAAEALSNVQGLAKDFAKPTMSGVTVSVRAVEGSYHRDAGGKGLWAAARTAIESAGVVGVALDLQATEELRPSMGVSEFADAMVVPPIEAALGVLEGGGFLGRALCRIDFVALGRVLGLGWANARASLHSHTESDPTLPADADEIKAVARLAATALGRSAGLPAWDEPRGLH